MAFDARRFFRTSNHGDWQRASDVLEEAFSFGYYGAFSDSTTQTIASTTTAYPMTLDTTDDAWGVSIVSGSRITFANPGTYNVQFSAQFDSSSVSTEDVSIWLRKNGTDVSGSAGFVSVPSSHGGTNGHALPSWNYVLTLIAGDYLQLLWSATSTSVALQAYGAQSSPTRPATASLIVTATQVGAVR